MKIDEVRKILNNKLVNFYKDRRKLLGLCPLSNTSQIERKIIALLCKDNDKFNVAVEFDKNNPAFGIYYGCLIENLKTNDVLEVASSWTPFLADLSKELEVVILEGDLYLDKTYWPLWIRLEENEPIGKVDVNLELIINYFSNKGYIRSL